MLIRYIGQLFRSMGKHLGEPALALVIMATIRDIVGLSRELVDMRVTSDVLHG